MSCYHIDDGEENASKEFSGDDIKKLVEELNKNAGHLPISGPTMM
jgi:hypothetical protein